MYEGEYLCYGQFDRDFINFLRRRKSEQYEELDIISAQGKLKITLNQIENIIEAARTYSVPNKTILQELSELKDKEIVTKTLSSDVFSYKFEQVIPRPKISLVEPESEVSTADSSRQNEEHATVEKQPEQSPPQKEDKETQITETVLDEQLQQLHQESSQLQETADAEEEDVEEPERPDDLARESDYPWRETWKELNHFEDMGKVSSLNKDFKRALMGFMLNPPDRRTQPPVTVPKIKSDRQLGRCYLDIGVAEVERGNFEKANTAYNEALKIGCGQDDKELQWKAYDGLGTVASLSKDYETSTKNFNAAVYLLDRELSTHEITSLRNHIIDKMERRV